MIKNIFTSIVVACFGLLFSQIALAQATDNGTLTGVVTDANGAVVVNATVTVSDSTRGIERTATTNEEGRWTLPLLQLGNYEVRAEATGYQPARQTVTVVASVATTVDLQLGVGEVGIQVDVEAGTEGTSLTNSDPTISTTITSERILDLPSINRNTFGATLQDTQTSSDILDPLTNGGGNPESAVNGLRPTSQSVLFNGIDATNFSGTGALTENVSPAPETVVEVKLLTNMDASLGRSGGGNFQVVTKSGTNNFNGTAYLFAQNEAFNANDFFFNRDGIDRQKARRLEGGFTLGGPIIKDKLFFFGGYQRTDANTAYVPTAQSFVVLPEGLAYITDRTTAQGIRQGFAVVNPGFSRPTCVLTTPTIISPSSPNSSCIDPFGPGFRLFTLRNPVTGDFLIPSLRPGYERLNIIGTNTTILSFSSGAIITDPATLGLDSFRLTDRGIESGINGGTPLVRQRNVFPSEFEQDQINARIDYNLFQGSTQSNRLEGTFFFADYPATDSFSDDTLVSPFPLVRDDRNRTLSIKDTHVFGANLFNEARFGVFWLSNTRQLDERLLQPEYTNEGVGIANPAEFFVPGPATQRLARFAGNGDLSDFSVGAPNDIFNRRKQVTLTFGDNITYVKGSHTLRFGVEHKRNFFDTNLPEEQGGEFENIDNFNQILLSYAPEADTAFGITDKQFRFNDLSFYASDDWNIKGRLTLNLGLRWDWFGWPTEKNGRFTNFDFSRVTNPNDIRPGFILPSNVKPVGIQPIDSALPDIARSESSHTLNGQDLNNFAPRFGFAFKPFKNDRTVIRGGYGIFYDRPSASFINTIYSNYPFLREIEETNSFAPLAVRVGDAFNNADPNTPFNSYLPLRICTAISAASAGYLLARLTPIPGTFPCSQENLAEPLEYRAIDRDLKTPLVQQWNLGIQQQLGDWTIEARYIGTRGQNLLLAIGFNQPYDLNDPNTPDYIFGRINDASGNQNLPPRTPGLSERERGRGIVFGSCNLVFVNVSGYPQCNNAPSLSGLGGFDLNLDPNLSPGGASFIPAVIRTPYLGFDQSDAVILQSRGYSFYHAAQLNVTRRFAQGFSFNASYTFSKSIDIGSTDPGSTTASGRPDTPNLGLVVQGNQRDLNSNRALSDFDRPHRFSASFVWELPTFGSKSRFLEGWQISGFGQWQSGTPFTIFNGNPDVALIGAGGSGELFQRLQTGTGSVGENYMVNGGVIRVRRQVFNVGLGTGTLYNTAFARPNVTSLSLLRQRPCDDFTRCYFNTNMRSTGFFFGTTFFPADPNAALASPLGGFGNLGRNTLRGPSQRRIDVSFQKSTRLTERVTLELKWDIFNIFNFVNFANPNSDVSDETDFGQITRTVGAPRVMNFGAKIRF